MKGWLGMIAVLVCCALTGAARAQEGTPGRIIAGPGVPLMLQGVEGIGAGSVLQAKGARSSLPGRRALKTESFSVRPDIAGTPDANWYWLTGSVLALKWEVVKAGAGTTMAWADAAPEEWAAARAVTIAPPPTVKGAAREVPLLWLGELDLAFGRDVLARSAEAMAGRIPEAERAQALGSLQAGLAMPGDRWRARALAKALGPAVPGAFEELSAASSALSVLCRQVEAVQWAALGRIAQVDRALAEQVAAAWVCMVRLPADEGGGAWAPVWAECWGGGGGPGDGFVEAVLAPGASPRQIGTQAQSWLSGQPGQIIWVRDDAGLRDALRGAQISTLGVVLGNAEKAIATVETSAARSGELTPLKLGVGQWLTATGPALQREASVADRLRAAAAGSEITVRLAGGGGVRTTTIASASVPVPAQPPGFSLGPLAADWTAAAWRKGQPTSASAVTVGMLLRGTEAAPWTLYLECKWAEGGAEKPGGDGARVWLGPSGGPVSVLEVSPPPREGEQGKVKVVRGLAAAGEVSVTRLAGGWCATIPLPAEVVEGGGIVRLGVERVDGLGRRSAWPRAMLPGGWQTEPGRLAIDVTAWDRGLEQP